MWPDFWESLGCLVGLGSNTLTLKHVLLLLILSCVQEKHGFETTSSRSLAPHSGDPTIPAFTAMLVRLHTMHLHFLSHNPSPQAFPSILVTGFFQAFLRAQFHTPCFRYHWTRKSRLKSADWKQQELAGKARCELGLNFYIFICLRSSGLPPSPTLKS